MTFALLLLPCVSLLRMCVCVSCDVELRASHTHTHVHLVVGVRAWVFTQGSGYDYAFSIRESSERKGERRLARKFSCKQTETFLIFYDLIARCGSKVQNTKNICPHFVIFAVGIPRPRPRQGGETATATATTMAATATRRVEWRRQRRQRDETTTMAELFTERTEATGDAAAKQARPTCAAKAFAALLSSVAYALERTACKVNQYIRL